MLQELGAGGLIANLGEGLTGTDHAPQPSTLIQTLNPQPSTLNPQPATLNLPRDSRMLDPHLLLRTCSTPYPIPPLPSTPPPKPSVNPVVLPSYLTAYFHNPNPQSQIRNPEP